ncbi:MAG: cyclase family protein [Luteibaculaceae bacterium]
MEINLQHQKKRYRANLGKPLPINLPMGNAAEESSAWYCEKVSISPVKNEYFTGSVALGGVVNFNNIFFNPHGNGTHTECVGHLDKQVHDVTKVLTKHFFIALLVTVEPTEYQGPETDWCKPGDLLISVEELTKQIPQDANPEALLVRTLPNSEAHKKGINYSNTNPVYFEPECGTLVRSLGIKHWLVDLPSVDREEDAGLLKCHRAFWDYPNTIDLERTLTELIYVPQTVTDGLYLLNLNVAPFVNDASPSSPTLYQLIEI